MSLPEAKRVRPVITKTFQFGPLAEDVGYKSVTIRELTHEDERRAMAHATTEPAEMLISMAQRAVVEAVTVDGAAVQISYNDATIDEFWARIGPRGRSLVLQAAQRVNSPAKEETDAFLRSVETQVG